MAAEIGQCDELFLGYHCWRPDPMIPLIYHGVI
jgi:hypothetical protein